MGGKTGNNPTDDRSKLGTKRHILTDKKGIPLSVVISSPASTHDINLVTDVVDNTVIKRPQSKSISSSSKSGSGRRTKRRQHLCLDKGYKSAQEEQELIKRGFVLHIPIKKKKKGKGEDGEEEEEEEEVTPFRKKYSAKRWVVERTNSWHNRFRKLFTRYEKKADNYLGLVQSSCCLIIYRKVILDRLLMDSYIKEAIILYKSSIRT
jgi:transposase